MCVEGGQRLLDCAPEKTVGRQESAFVVVPHQKDEQGHERVIAYFSKKLSETEMNYTANERELLGLVYFLKRFRCYLEGSTFDVITDNQVLRHFFSKPNMSRKEARWLDLLSQFNTDALTLRSGRIHVLGDSLSRVAFANVHVVNVELPQEVNYDSDAVFGPVFKALQGELPGDAERRNYIERVLPHFKCDGHLLRYKGRICVPRRNVRELLQLAHDCNIGGHFGTAKTMGILEDFYWKHKTRDVERYCRGCLKCQQSKDSRSKKLTSPNPLGIPSRR